MNTLIYAQSMFILSYWLHILITMLIRLLSSRNNTWHNIFMKLNSVHNINMYSITVSQIFCHLISRYIAFGYLTGIQYMKVDKEMNKVSQWWCMAYTVRVIDIVIWLKSEHWITTTRRLITLNTFNSLRFIKNILRTSYVSIFKLYFLIIVIFYLVALLKFLEVVKENISYLWYLSFILKCYNLLKNNVSLWLYYIQFNIFNNKTINLQENW